MKVLISILSVFFSVGGPLVAGVQYSVVGNPTAATAANPRGAWVFSGGFFYGASQEGNNATNGTVYRFDPNTGIFTVVHGFSGGNGGTGLSSGIILGSNSFFYGATYGGMNNNLGTLFRVNAAGTFSTLHQFEAVTGGGPDGHPIEGNDNKIYGMVASGNPFVFGGIYRMNLDGSNYSLLRAFTGVGGPAPGWGGEQSGGIIEGPGGLLFGALSSGGVDDRGVIFSMEKDADPYTVLHHFRTSGLNTPSTPLLFASDGFFYGCVSNGGVANRGGIYRIAPDGTGFEVIHEFTESPDGYLVGDKLTEGSDGYLYGAAFYSSTNSGSVFRLPKNGKGFAVLHRFAGGPSDGSQADCPLIETEPGTFFGTTFSGGTTAKGTIFKLIATLEPPTVAVTGSRKPKFKSTRLRLRGSATDELEIDRVEYNTGKEWQTAIGTSSWSVKIPVKKKTKRLTVKVRSIDNDGLSSPLATIRARRAS